MKQLYILCPVCQKHKFPIWEDNGTCICPNCGWEHDLSDEENPLELNGPNDLCLNNYKLRYEYYVNQNPNYHWARDKYPDIPQVEKSLCPVCKKFQFEPITWDDLYCGIVPSDVYCFSCGWHYDSQQSESPDKKNGANEMSLNEYKAWYAKKTEENSKYSFFNEETSNYVSSPHKCPVCGKYRFKDLYSFDICPFCGWEDDGSDEDNNEISGPNNLRFSDYKKHYDKIIHQQPDYKWIKNSSK